MKTATVEIAVLKSTVYCDLRTLMSTQAKAHDNPVQTVSVMTTTYHAAVTESFTTVKSTKRGMTGPCRKRTMTQVSSRALRDLSESFQCVLLLPI